MESQWIEGEEVLESSKVSLNLVSKEVQVLKAGGVASKDGLAKCGGPGEGMSFGM